MSEREFTVHMVDGAVWTIRATSFDVSTAGVLLFCDGDATVACFAAGHWVDVIVGEETNE